MSWRVIHCLVCSLEGVAQTELHRFRLTKEVLRGLVSSTNCLVNFTKDKQHAPKSIKSRVGEFFALKQELLLGVKCLPLD